MEYEFLKDQITGSDDLDSKSHENIAKFLQKIITNQDINMIGLEGEWGSGKSNVIEILKNKVDKNFIFFTYDAWGHQVDLQRLTFLEELIDELEDKGIKLYEDKKSKKSIKDNIFYEKEEKEEDKKYNINDNLKDLILFIMFLELIMRFDFKNYFYIKNFFIVILIMAFAYALIKFNFDDFLAIFKNIFSNTRTITKKRTKNPSVKEFKKCFEEISKKLGNKKLIIVYDNIDRLKPDDVKNIWSSLSLLFAQDFNKNITTIIPFSKKHILQSFNIEDDKYESEKFLTKIFPVIIPVPKPPNLSWKEYFSKKFEEIFEENKNLNEVLMIFSCMKDCQNFREMICFINNLSIYYQILDKKISLDYIALYLYLKDEISENFDEKIIFLWKQNAEEKKQDQEEKRDQEEKYKKLTEKIESLDEIKDCVDIVKNMYSCIDFKNSYTNDFCKNMIKIHYMINDDSKDYTIGLFVKYLEKFSSNTNFLEYILSHKDCLNEVKRFNKGDVLFEIYFEKNNFDVEKCKALKNQFKDFYEFFRDCMPRRIKNLFCFYKILYYYDKVEFVKLKNDFNECIKNNFYSFYPSIKSWSEQDKDLSIDKIQIDINDYLYALKQENLEDTIELKTEELKTDFVDKFFVYKISNNDNINFAEYGYIIKKLKNKYKNEIIKTYFKQFEQAFQLKEDKISNFLDELPYIFEIIDKNHSDYKNFCKTINEDNFFKIYSDVFGYYYYLDNMAYIKYLQVFCRIIYDKIKENPKKEFIHKMCNDTNLAKEIHKISSGELFSEKELDDFKKILGLKN